MKTRIMLTFIFCFLLFLSNEIIEITMRIKCTTNSTLKHTNKNNQSAIHNNDEYVLHFK